MNFAWFSLSLFLVLFTRQAEAQPHVGRADKASLEVPELAQHFTSQQATGTFVLLDLSTDKLQTFNSERANKRFVPASTFKIPHTLIGLNAKAVKSVDEVLPYGGKPQPFKDWEHDMPLREAIKLSAVPIYQELARRVGPERMAAGLKSFQYGNQKIGSKVDRFWLDGPLEISAVEQVQFLSKLVRGKLPVAPAAMAAVKEITLQEKTDTYELHYKTGWAFETKPQVGWVVGWVTTGEQSSCFALNIDMEGLKDAPKRVTIAKECLRTLGKLGKQ